MCVCECARDALMDPFGCVWHTHTHAMPYTHSRVCVCVKVERWGGLVHVCVCVCVPGSEANQLASERASAVDEIYCEAPQRHTHTHTHQRERERELARHCTTARGCMCFHAKNHAEKVFRRYTPTARLCHGETRLQLAPPRRSVYPTPPPLPKEAKLGNWPERVMRRRLMVAPPPPAPPIGTPTLTKEVNKNYAVSLASSASPSLKGVFSGNLNWLSYYI